MKPSFAQLRAYLSEVPSRECWWKIVSLLDTWEEDVSLAMDYTKAALEDTSWSGLNVPSQVWSKSSRGWELSLMKRHTIASLPNAEEVFCPAGKYWGGSPETDGDADDDEYPWREMEVNDNLWCQTTLVTQEQWSTLMGNNPAECKGDQHPVEYVNFYDAAAFCNALSRAEGLEEAYILTDEQNEPGSRDYSARIQWKGFESPGYRIARETEWEYLCRAGSEKSRYAPLEDVAWYSGNTDDMVTMPVGLKEPNAWGLYDMLGNVFEWVWSHWDTSEPGFHDTRLEFTKAAEQVPLRGGSTFYSENDARCAARVNCDTFYKYGDMGFRVVRNA